jgi:hypothetical protein
MPSLNCESEGLDLSLVVVRDGPEREDWRQALALGLGLQARLSGQRPPR